MSSIYIGASFITCRKSQIFRRNSKIYHILENEIFRWHILIHSRQINSCVEMIDNNVDNRQAAKCKLTSHLQYLLTNSNLRMTVGYNELLSMFSCLSITVELLCWLARVMWTNKVSTLRPAPPLLVNICKKFAQSSVADHCMSDENVEAEIFVKFCSVHEN